MKLLHQRRVQIIAALALALLALLALYATSGPREPEYQGKKLSTWLSETETVSTGRNNYFVEKLSKPAQEAIRAMGTNALPFLWHELNATDSPSRKHLIDLLRRQPIRALDLTPASTRQSQAMRAIFALGTNAAPLAPSLILWLGENHPERDIAILLFRGFLGPAALPALHDALRHHDLWTRTQAAIILGRLDPTTTAHLPVLTEALRQSSDLKLRLDTLAGLGAISTHAYEPLLHALLLCLQDPDQAIRTNANAILTNSARNRPDLLRTIAAKTKDPILIKAAQEILAFLERDKASTATP